MVGRTISHYKILKVLGSGGMGVVYKARDNKLNRLVALKFLPSHLTRDESTRKRFIAEAQAASALDHPNISNIHEINETEDGQLYICMAYYEGESLRQKIKKSSLTFEESLNIFYQIALGLKAAHEEKIIHRDIKPGNIIITDKGETKIVDFGLAKLAGEKITESISTKGTFAYMAPEVIRSLPEDQRTDIWSLGVLLYEMLTGHLPFTGEYPEPLMYSILNEAPKPLSQYLNKVPDLLQDIILKLLKKDPSERYQNLSELMVDLNSLVIKDDSIVVKTKPAILKQPYRRRVYLYSVITIFFVILFLIISRTYLFPDRIEGKLIAVLPLKTISNDKEQEWFTEGMTDVLITDLAKISGLRVISLSTAMKYKGTNKAPPEIAEELGVQYVIEGSTVKIGDLVKVSVRLINAPNDEYIWADNYDRKFQDVFILFTEVASDIANEIGPELTKEELKRFASVLTVNPEAYELYLKGNYHFNKYEKAEVIKATDYFQKAIKVDSSFAKPYAGLIYCYGFYTYYGELEREEGISKIRTSIKKALELDENLAEAYQGLAAYRLHQEWDWEGAGEAFSRALVLNPNLSGIYGTEYAWYLTYIGQSTEAILEAQRLMQVDPLSYTTRMTANYVYYCDGQYDKAVELCKRTIELEPENLRTYEDLARNYEHLLKYDDAHKSRLSALNVSGVASELIFKYDSLYNILGLKAYPTWLLTNRNEMTGWAYNSLCDEAWIHTKLSENDKALSLLEQAYEEKEGELVTLKTDPKWDPLRGESRFQELLKRMNFPK